MDANEALERLQEISAQVEAAVIFDQDSVVGSTLGDDGRAGEIARAARNLLEQAALVREATGKPLVQLQATTREGSVFVVHAEGRSIVATTGADPVPGLVFYDLKTCLRSVAEEEAAASVGAKPTRKRAEGAAP